MEQKGVASTTHSGGVKFTTPTKYDKAKYGYIWTVVGDNETTSIYIQTSKDEDNPSWTSMGSFLEKVFAKDLTSPEFVEYCLERYK